MVKQLIEFFLHYVLWVHAQCRSSDFKIYRRSYCLPDLIFKQWHVDKLFSKLYTENSSNFANNHAMPECTNNNTGMY